MMNKTDLIFLATTLVTSSKHGLMVPNKDEATKDFTETFTKWYDLLFDLHGIIEKKEAQR